MLDVIERLLQLQDRDRNLLQVQEALRRIPTEREELRLRLESAQKALESAKHQVMHLESERKRLELEVVQKQQQIEKYSLQQYQTKKNEEYRAIGHEISLCKQAVTDLEDTELDVMEKIESGQRQVAAAQRHAAETQRTVEGRLGDLAGRETELQAQLRQLEEDRTALAGAIDPGALARYERLLKSKGGNVLVGIQHGVCGGCHMQLSRQTVVDCQAEKEIVSCSNCGRILYFTPDMDVSLVE
ncbi:MAG: hypothetical protein JXQ71_04835 [Verrucomicrobia bacterium]|nr:hypothetical protein [Verrucomicrobiota bacterium]